MKRLLAVRLVFQSIFIINYYLERPFKISYIKTNDSRRI